MAAAFGESHSAERRQRPSKCCYWLAEHRQCVHQRGSQEHKIIAHLLPMILVGRESFLGGTGKHISEVEKDPWHPGVKIEFQGCAWAGSD